MNKIIFEKNKLIYFLESILPISIFESNLIKEQLTYKTFSKGEKICDVSFKCRNIGFVTKGIFRVLKTNEQGKSYIPYFIQEGHFAVDIDSFINNTTSTETIEAISECNVVCISKEAYKLFEKEVDNFKSIMDFIKQKALLEKSKLKNELFSQDALTRYKKIQNSNPELIQKVSQGNLALFLGISQYTLSRIRKAV